MSSYDAGRKAAAGSSVVIRKDQQGFRAKCHGCGAERHGLNAQGAALFHQSHREHRV